MQDKGVNYSLQLKSQVLGDRADPSPIVSRPPGLNSFFL